MARLPPQPDLKVRCRTPRPSRCGHSLANLLGGYAREHSDEIVAFLRRRNFEDLAPRYDEAVARGDHALATNILYYSLRAFIHEPGIETAARMAAKLKPRK